MTRYNYITSCTGNYDLLKQNAKKNRANATPAEDFLWEHIRNKKLGVKFRRQHPIHDFIADFVCIRLGFVIEVDGGYHYTRDAKISDDERTIILNNYGFEVIRFSNEEILHNIDSVLEKIEEIIKIKNNDTMIAKENNSPLLGRGRGRLLIFSAPSGSGKSTIVQWLMNEHPELKLAFSVSATSRKPRCNNGVMEQNGVEYFFLSPEEFKQKIAAGEFLEYEEVYENIFYGTLSNQVEKQRNEGINVVFDIDVKGGVNIKKQFEGEALSIFIQPPSVEELRRRLEGRGSNTPEQIAQRLAKAEYEMTFAPQFDKVVVNDNLETAKQEVYKLISDFVCA